MKKLAIVFSLLCGLPLTAQVVLVGHTAVGSADSATVTTPPMNTQGANFIAICGSGSSGNVMPPTDNMGNTYTLLFRQSEDGDSSIGLWYAINPTVAAGHTFTRAGRSPALAVMAFSGVASFPDKFGSSQGLAPVSAAAITPSNDNELIVSCGVKWGGALASYGSGMKIADALPTLGNGHSSYGTASAYKIQTKAASVQPTLGARDGSVGAVVTASAFSKLSPQLLSMPSQVVTEGWVGQKDYSYPMQATGGSGPYTWKITSGSLPAGLSMDASGLITGNPTAVTNSAITFQVTDSASSTVSASLHVAVAASKLTIAGGTCGKVIAGTQYKAFSGCTLAASGGTPPYSFYWNHTSAMSLPEGLTLDVPTGNIGGIVYGQGNYGPRFYVVDSVGSISGTLPKNQLLVTFAISGNNAKNAVQLFPSDSIFHVRVDGLPVDTSQAVTPPFNAAYLSQGITPEYDVINGGIPYLVVPWNQPFVPVKTKNKNNKGSSFTSAPIPPYAAVEGSQNGTGDRHLIIVQEAGGGHPAQLWEMWEARPESDGSWKCENNFHHPNLSSGGPGAYAMITGKDDGGTADAAGLPMTPFITTADEVIGTGTPTAPNGTVTHAQRLAVIHSLAYFVWPGSAFSGTGQHSCTGGYQDPNDMLLQTRPSTGGCRNTGPDGEIYRIKASTPTPPCMANSPQASILFDAWKKYGLILADVASYQSVTLTADARWVGEDLNCLKHIHLSDLEPVDVSGIAVDVMTSYRTKTSGSSEATNGAQKAK